MEINSTTPSNEFIGIRNTHNIQVCKNYPIQSKDTITLSPESLLFSKYVDVVKQLPEERSDVVDKFKKIICDGSYEPFNRVTSSLYLLNRLYNV